MSETFDPETGELEIVSGALSVIRQEIDIQIATSKRFPRPKDLQIALTIAGRATLNADIAAECLYNLPRDGKTISGPSIRFAEIVRSCYGNIRVAARFVRIDSDDKQRQAVICESVAYDTQLNDCELSQVRRSIMTSGKAGAIPRPFSADMIATTVMAAQAIARRNAILALVPKAVWIDAFGQVERVVRGDAATLTERRTKMIAEFAKFDVTAAMIFHAMGVDTENEIGLNEMPLLAGMWTALRDGEAAESVLGMMAQSRARPRPTVDNPMANRGGPFTEQARKEGLGLPDGVHVELTPEEVEAAKRQGITLMEAASRKFAAQQQLAASEAAQREAEAAEKRAAAALEKADPRGSGGSGRGGKKSAAASEQPPAQAEPQPKTTPVTGEMPELPKSLDRREEAKKTDAPAEMPAVADKPAMKPEEVKDFATAMAFIGRFTGNAASLMDWWRRVKDLRSAFSFDQQGEINKAYNARFSVLDKD